MFSVDEVERDCSQGVVTSVHLVVNAASAHGNFECAVVSPGAVPGVDAEPVVLAVLDAPSDGLDSVATESFSRLVSVDSTLVGEEVFVDCEGRSDGTVLGNVLLDGVNAAKVVTAGSEVLVGVVVDESVADALAIASWSDLSNIVARLEVWDSDVMSAHWHSVVVAEVTSSVVSSSNDSLSLEPGPWCANLATIASE